MWANASILRIGPSSYRRTAVVGPLSHPRCTGLPPVFLDQRLLKKVPEVTIYFWVIKVLTTGMGETTSDFFVHRYNPYVVVVVSAAVLAASVFWQRACSGSCGGGDTTRGSTG